MAKNPVCRVFLRVLDIFDTVRDRPIRHGFCAEVSWIAKVIVFFMLKKRREEIFTEIKFYFHVYMSEHVLLVWKRDSHRHVHTLSQWHGHTHRHTNTYTRERETNDCTLLSFTRFYCMFLSSLFLSLPQCTSVGHVQLFDHHP